MYVARKEQLARAVIETMPPPGRYQVYVQCPYRLLATDATRELATKIADTYNAELEQGAKNAERRGL